MYDGTRLTSRPASRGWRRRGFNMDWFYREKVLEGSPTTWASAFAAMREGRLRAHVLSAKGTMEGVLYSIRPFQPSAGTPLVSSCHLNVAWWLEILSEETPGDTPFFSYLHFRDTMARLAHQLPALDTRRRYHRRLHGEGILVSQSSRTSAHCLLRLYLSFRSQSLGVPRSRWR